MQLQFDPYAFAVALCAVGIAWRAHHLAKKAPLLARRLQIRDEIRTQIAAVDAASAELQKAIDFGEPIPERPKEFEAALTEMQRLAARVPESADILLLHALAQGASSGWSIAFFSQSRGVRAREQVTYWEDQVRDSAEHSDEAKESARKYLIEYREEVEKNRLASEAARTSLREAMSRYTEKRKAYVGWLDSHDRGRK